MNMIHVSFLDGTHEEKNLMKAGSTHLQSVTTECDANKSEEENVSSFDYSVYALHQNG